MVNHSTSKFFGLGHAGYTVRALFSLISPFRNSVYTQKLIRRTIPEPKHESLILILSSCTLNSKNLDVGSLTVNTNPTVR